VLVERSVIRYFAIVELLFHDVVRGEKVQFNSKPPLWDTGKQQGFTRKGLQSKRKAASLLIKSNRFM